MSTSLSDVLAVLIDWIDSFLLVHSKRQNSEILQQVDRMRRNFKDTFSAGENASNEE